ncbi:MAG: peptidoglycan bridge formation glycyltransferase FemA/FemB family protein [Clostridia bacterium]|nr:peptidoglycan bridge formation glycyltransferase FemA/FemB family protein [Clostridia bacterium]MBQ9966167.1 peptidoglycan bridge formation glycyltransferase FemA/FemB family protein [Clostridia bacterium]
MFEIINSSTLQEFESFIENHPKGHFLQSSRWGKVKSSWDWQAIAVRGEDGKIKGAMSVLIRKMPMVPYTLMYSGRGPVCDPHDKETLHELTEGLKVLAKKHRSYAVKMDPDILSSDEEFIANMQELGYKRHFGSKNFEGVQPGYVFRLNVKDKTEDELLGAFHSKTRYNLRLSVRKGVTVKLVQPHELDAELTHFSAIMDETGTRDGFIVRPKEYFASIMKELGENARLYMAYWDERPIAGTLAIWFGNKVWYLYGASSNAYRNVMPNYQLQWEMIRWSLEKNCDIYDFRGVSGDTSPENPLHGLYLFKKGFSGDFTEFCGEFEMVFKPAVDLILNKGLSAARDIRRKIVIGKKRKEAEKQAKPAERAPVTLQEKDKKEDTPAE